MNFFIVSIFPNIFKGFVEESLIWKWINKRIINIQIFNPRDFSAHSNKQVDDKIYWWWKWMLLMFQPIVDCIEYIITKKIKNNNYKIVYLAPTQKILNQNIVQSYLKYSNIILLCGRYEWIDYRIEEYFQNKIERLSIWKYILMGWEVASMVFIEVVSRYVRWVVKETDSIKDDSYTKDSNLSYIEYPQYTRPAEIKWLKVPDVLLSWNHKEIEKWRNVNNKKVK